MFKLLSIKIIVHTVSEEDSVKDIVSSAFKIAPNHNYSTKKIELWGLLRDLGKILDSSFL